MTEQAETNGTTNGHSAKPSKPESALTLLLASMKGQKAPNESDKKAVTNAFKKAMGERAKLQAALDKFDAEADATAVQMVRCYGAKHLTVDGVRYVPTSRGSRVYYKRMSDSTDVVEL